MNELDKNRLNSKHMSLLVNETSVTDSTEEKIKHQIGDLLSASLTLIPETQAFVRFLTPRAVLSLDQSFFTHWSRAGEFIRPPFSSLHFLGKAVCSADPQVESVLSFILSRLLAVVYLCFILSRLLAVVYLCFILSRPLAVVDLCFIPSFSL